LFINKYEFPFKIASECYEALTLTLSLVTTAKLGKTWDVTMWSR